MKHWTELYNRNAILLKQRKIHKAVEYSRKIFEIEPQIKHPQVWHQAGVINLQLYGLKDAKPYFLKSIKGYRDLLNFSDQFLWQDNNNIFYSEAYKLKIHDMNLYYLYEIASIYALLKDKKKMMQFIVKCFLTEDYTETVAINFTKDSVFSEYANDKDFLKLVNSRIKKYRPLRKLKTSTSTSKITQQQLKLKTIFIETLQRLGWKENKKFTKTFGKLYARFELQHAYYNTMLSLHLNSKLIVVNIEDADFDSMAFYLYYKPLTMEKDMIKTLKIISKYMRDFSVSSYTKMITQCSQHVKNHKIEGPDGREITIEDFEKRLATFV
jgi:hypothetical protein